MVLVLAACSATSGAAASNTAATAAPQVAAGTPSTTSAAPLQAQTTSASDFSTAIQTVANSVRPAVVQITNMQSQVGPFNQGAAVPAGVGSGVIHDGSGHILTNDHVIAGAQQLEVSLPDKRSFPATIVGEDPQTDLAVVQISGDNLPIAALGASSNMQVGAWVVAIGNAHPYLGIAYGPLTPSLAVRLGVNTDYGFLVGQVAPGSPAASAGIQPGDLITAVDG